MMRASGPTPDVEYRGRLILWLAMTFAIVMYFVVIQRVTPASPQENPTLVYAMLAASVALVAASFVVKAKRVPDILALALCEAAALLGVVAWFTTGWSRSYVFLIVGLAGILLHYPRREA